KYPFLFSLTVTYTLVDTKVVVDYKVENTGKKEMYFSIGAHPGFNCPIVEDETFEDYSFSFLNKEKIEIFDLEGPFRKKEKKILQAPTDTLPLSINLFKND